ncbi:MAG: class I SAM-dependent rRNA methyltransferase [Gemmatimonadales bacterium]|nr:MAG: class I SAM-dependent rRNA methyltransferase [Gemmatimonadales bacterium]
MGAARPGAATPGDRGRRRHGTRGPGRSRRGDRDEPGADLRLRHPAASGAFAPGRIGLRSGRAPLPCLDRRPRGRGQGNTPLSPSTTPGPDDAPITPGPPLAVRVTPAAERAVRDGHPWVFENSIREISREGVSGDIAVLFDRKNRFLAVGLFDPESPIRVRILSAGSPAKVGAGLFRTRLAEALKLRRRLVDDPETTGFRILSGEGDRVPGLVLDRYGEGLVLKCYTPAWLPWLDELRSALDELLPSSVLAYLPSRGVSGSPATPDTLRTPVLLSGPPLDDGLEFLEGGLRYRAHPFVGHKTGFYLDQRENRARVRELARGLRVLNVFSYTGGFSLAAAAGGAPGVLSTDLSEPALREAERHFELNAGLEAVRSAAHETRTGDAFEVMEALDTAGERFGMVVVDPPSFAREKGQEAGALRAYGKLTQLALKLIEPGGILVQASCTARIDAESFFLSVLNTARSADRSLEVIAQTGHPVDHPVRHPEGEYLKCLFGRVPTAS